MHVHVISFHRSPGMWYKHERQGEGKMIWRDRKGGKEIFVGQWEAGIQHGKGKHVWFYKRVASSQYPIRNSYEGTLFSDAFSHAHKSVCPSVASSVSPQLKTVRNQLRQTCSRLLHTLFLIELYAHCSPKVILSVAPATVAACFSMRVAPSTTAVGRTISNMVPESSSSRMAASTKGFSSTIT